MAANASAVTVLTPNGRRQTIKVSPNTPLLQVLEDVCKKHGFNPDDHGLKFQRTVVDLTLPWRFANLPNNAKLEMVTSSRKQAEAQVRIALQREDGSRLQASFSSGQSLWELLTHFPEISGALSCESGSTPVCVYMRDEVSGEEALKKTTLKSLGLTGGSAIVRFLLKNNKSPSEDDASETAAIPKAPVAMETVPRRPDPTPSPPSPPPNRGPSPEVQMETSPRSPVTPADPVRRGDAPNSQNAVRQEELQVGSLPSVDDGEEAGPSGLNSHPSSSSSSAAPFIPFSGGGQRLGGPAGLSSSSSSSLSALPPVVESPKAKKAKPSHGSSSKCKSGSSRKDERSDQVEFLEPVEREAMVYHQDSLSRRSEDHADLPDEFFEVTVDDIRKRFAQLKSERKLLEEAPLMTKSLREAQMKEKMHRYPRVVLRVQFPDRHVLQGFFRPLETVGAVRHFVRSHLEDPQLSFYLFITPPKTILSDPSATLFQADLFPGAVVFFGSNVQTDFYIKRELLQSSVSASQANQSIASCILRSPTSSPTPMSVEEAPSSPEPPPSAGGSARSEQNLVPKSPPPRTSRTEPGKVPKWLKLPGKK